MRRTLAQQPPVAGIDAADETVGVEAGRAVERQDLTGVGVQGHHRAALARREDPRDVALEVEIDRRVHGLARLGAQPGRRRRVAHDVSQRAHLHEAHAVGAPQRVVILALEAVPPDLGSGAQSGALAQLLLGHLAHVAEQMRGDAAVGIVALGLGLDYETRHEEPALFQLRHYGERRVGHDQRRLVGCATEPRDHALDPRAVQSDERRDALQPGAQARDLRVESRLRAGQQRHGVPGHVVGEHPPVAVGDDPARRGEDDRPQAVGLGLQFEPAVLQNLRAEEPDADHHEGTPHQGVGDAQAAVEQVGVE